MNKKEALEEALHSLKLDIGLWIAGEGIFIEPVFDEFRLAVIRKKREAVIVLLAMRDATD